MYDIDWSLSIRYSLVSYTGHSLAWGSFSAVGVFYDLSRLDLHKYLKIKTLKKIRVSINIH